ncbi:hypothetical protein LPJ69_001948 [Coemansia sp. RSA 1752]|nr:hypothetical protein LPJ69_001948 [Coemansia sp. RSA 1752]
MSETNKLSAAAAEQAVGVQASVQDANAQLFASLMNAPNKDPSAVSTESGDAYYQKLVGKKFISPAECDKLMAEGKDAIDPNNTFTVDDLPKNHRYYKEGDMITLDMDESRLNVVLNKASSAGEVRDSPAPAKPQHMEVDASETISKALMYPNLIVAGEGFSALLVSAIESNDGNMPVLSI